MAFMIHHLLVVAFKINKPKRILGYNMVACMEEAAFRYVLVYSASYCIFSFAMYLFLWYPFNFYWANMVGSVSKSLPSNQKVYTRGFNPGSAKI